MPRTNKPSLSSTFSPINPRSFGPFYGLREGSGATTSDDSPTATTALSLAGATAWVSKAAGPEVRTSAAGDYLVAADAPGLRRPATAFTVAVGITPSGTWTYNSIGPLLAGKMYGYNYASFGVHSSGNQYKCVRAVLRLGGTTYYTQDSADTKLTNGTAYLVVARWQSGSHPNIRVYNRTTAALVAEVTGTTSGIYTTTSDAPPPTGTIDVDSRPFSVGRLSSTEGGGDYAYGDYEFIAVSNKRLSDSDLNAFAADPWADYGASSANYALSGPATGMPGSASGNFKVQLNYGVNPASPVTITPAVSGMTGTCSPATVTLSTSARLATFTLTPAMSTASGIAGSVSVTNSGGLANPDAATFTAAYAAPSGLSAFQSQLAWPISIAPYVEGTGFYLNGSEHYDPTRCFQNVRDYLVANSLTPTDWSVPITASLVRYRDRYVLPYAGQAQLYHAYSTGMARHYAETGDIDSRDAAMTLDPICSQNALRLAKYFKGFEMSRETAFALLDSLDAEWLGRDHADLTEMLAFYASGHVDQWTRPDGQRPCVLYVRPFMVALTCEALIAYWTRFRHNPSTAVVTLKTGVTTTQADLVAAIPAKIKAACDWIWSRCWYPDGVSVNIDQSTTPWTHGSFVYTDIDTASGTLSPVSSSVATGSATLEGFIGAAGLSPQDDRYRLAYIRWTSGALSGTFSRVGSYTGATRAFSLDSDYGLPNSAPANGDTFDIVGGTDPPYGAANTGGTGATPDVNHLIAPMFAWYYWYTVNVASARDNAYRQRFDDVFNGGTMCHQAPTAQKQFNQATRWIFTGFDWRSRGDSEWTGATTYTLTGPSPASGQANMPSGLFKVALPSGKSVANPVTITLASSSGVGAFVPTVAVLTTERPSAIFRFVPALPDANATVTITTTNDGGLSNPAGVAYTVGTARTLATGYTAVGPATGQVNVPAPFTLTTVPADAALPLAWLRVGGGTLMVQPNDQWKGGAYNFPARPGPTSYLFLSSDRPSQDFTYTPKSTGVKSLTFDNTTGVTPPPVAIAFTATATVSVATTYTLTGPASGPVGRASTVFTVTPVGGTFNGMVTPSDGGAGGTFSPAALSWTGGSTAQTLMYTPATGGPRSISCSSGGVLTDPSPLAFTATASTYTLSGPASGAAKVASVPFTVALPVGQPLLVPVTITPSADVAGGVFTPASVVLSGTTTSASFVYAPASAGVATVSCSSGGVLSDPPGVAYRVTQSTGPKHAMLPRVQRSSRARNWGRL